MIRMASRVNFLVDMVASPSCTAVTLAVASICNFPSTARAADAEPVDLQEVVVSARHTSETAVAVPEAISVLGSEALQNLNVQTFEDYAAKVPNLSFGFGGGAIGYAGSRTVAIRGISGANTTGFYIDDTPLPAAVDPQVVDIARIEVLKGPQGTLYGAGSMGGNVRIVTQQPTFKDEFKYSASAGYTNHGGSPDGRATVIGNIPLIDNVAALRVVGFAQHDGGYVTRTYSNRLPTSYPTPSLTSNITSVDNQGAESTFGGSASLLVKPIDPLTITARLMVQNSYEHGVPVLFAPVPGFSPNGYTLPRQADVQERASDRWYLPSLEIEYQGSHWSITSATSYFHENIFDLEDGTEGTLDLENFFFGVVLPTDLTGVPWVQTIRHNYFNEEVRASIGDDGPVRAIVGARYANNRDDTNIPPTLIPSQATLGLWPDANNWSSDLPYNLRDISAFGEVYFTLSKFELTLGARRFSLREVAGATADGLLNGGPSLAPLTTTTESGVSPKAALKYQPTHNMSVYATASKGFRPGGPNVPLPTACDPYVSALGGASVDQLARYKSDSLWNYEVGAKADLSAISLSVALFQMDWSDIQQRAVIPVCSFGVNINAGKARIRGTEFEATGHVTRDFEVRLALGYEDPRLVDPGLSGLPANSRIPQIPFFTGSVAVTYSHALTGAIRGFISADYSYTGSSLSNTSSVYTELERAGYSSLNGRLGAQWDANELQLYLKNLTNAEPNVGDIYPLAFNQLNTEGNQIPRVVTMRPFQIGLQFRHNF